MSDTSRVMKNAAFHPIKFAVRHGDSGRPLIQHSQELDQLISQNQQQPLTVSNKTPAYSRV